MDYEIQYRMTIDYVDRVLEASKDILDVYRVCVPFRVTTCTVHVPRTTGVPGDKRKRSVGQGDAGGGNDRKRLPVLQP